MDSSYLLVIFFFNPAVPGRNDMIKGERSRFECLKIEIISHNDISKVLFLPSFKDMRYLGEINRNHQPLYFFFFSPRPNE